MMRLTLLLLVLCLLPMATRAGEKDGRLFEMRIYYAAPDKLDDLHARFRNHTVKLFEKHGMTNLGYWTPLENPENKLIYVLAYPDKASRDKSWKAFGADPDWKKAFAESEKKGKLVAKAESIFMTATDYSPAIKATTEGKRVFELRTYTATPKNLEALNARFRNHTLKLFEKHGMKNLAYWTLTKDSKGADSTLIYILAHQSVDAAKASFDGFRKDPDWISARKQSEEKAGGSLTTKDGVRSVFMQATDYSATK